MDAQVESFLAIAISFSVPSLATQVKNTQSSKISWPFDLAPSNKAMASINLLAPFPHEGSPDLIDCLNNPFREQEKELINMYGYKH
jgi:hypothetical protein